MIASDMSGSWNATLAQEYLMSHQRPDGSFGGGLFDTNAVLPLLAGRTLLSVADQPCLMQPQHRNTDGYVWQGQLYMLIHFLTFDLKSDWYLRIRVPLEIGDGGLTRGKSTTYSVHLIMSVI